LRIGLTAESTHNRFISCGIRLDQALQGLSIALQSRVFVKMDTVTFPRNDLEEWQQQVIKAGEKDMEMLGSDVQRLMANNEAFREEALIMFREFGSEIKHRHLVLHTVLSDEFGRINDKLDKIDSKLDAIQQQEDDVPIIEWDELELVEDDKPSSGGYGTVYEGRWGNREVAIKVMDIGKVGKRVMKELQKEAKMHCGLRHPNVIFFYGIVLSPEPALVMEWAAPDLLFFLQDWDDDEVLPWNERWLMAKQIAKGMKFVHSNHILHHDLRAANVLIGPKGARLCRLCDFGLSRWKQQSSRNSNQQTGNPHWMAPEYSAGGVFTTACDVFSFGVLMYEIASYGTTPYHGRADVRDLYKEEKRNEKIEDIEDIPQEYKEMIQLCWHQFAKKRPSFEKIFSMISASKLASPKFTV